MDDLSPHEQVAAAKRDAAALMAGRKLLGLSVDGMADEAKLEPFQIVRNEMGVTTDLHATMRQFLEARGVQFGEDGSVSLSAPGKEEALTHG